MVKIYKNKNENQGIWKFSSTKKWRLEDKVESRNMRKF